MQVIRVRNVHEALPMALNVIREIGQWESSRNGRALVSPEPIATVYEQPTERVLLHPWRDANPFFHFYESLWMLAGRNDVAPLTRYVSSMRDFSDDTETFNAAYGDRWRRAVSSHPSAQSWTVESRDQLEIIVDRLKHVPNDRRSVLQIWDHSRDLRATTETQTRDSACNVAATFQIGTSFGVSRLNMSVFCRSNDLIWGCYGANAVHYSALQEYVARCVGVEIGTYTQISVNWHAYEDVYEETTRRWRESMASQIPHQTGNPYTRPVNRVAPYPLMRVSQREWDADVRAFVTADGRAPDPDIAFSDPFFSEVATPIVRAHDIYRDIGRSDRAIDQALDVIRTCAATDWRLACAEWLERRRPKLSDNPAMRYRP